jgi:hypothetical protein
VTTRKNMKRRDITARDRRALYALVPTARSKYLEPLIVQGLGPFGFDPDLHLAGRKYQQQTADTLINQRERLRALGYVLERKPVGPRGEQRWVIAGYHRAQARAYELGLIGGNTGRAVEHPHAVAIVTALEDHEPDYVVKLAVELASARPFPEGLVAAKRASA